MAASYTPPATGRITYFDTEITEKKQLFQVGLSYQFRIITYSTTRAVYDTIANAKAALTSYMSVTSASEVRDGATRRIADNGWCECLFVSREIGQWQNPPSS